MVEKFYDVIVEQNILRAVLQNKNFYSSVMTYNKIVDEHFTDQFCRDAWKVIRLFHKKYGKPPKQSLLSKYISKYITYHKNFKTKQAQLKIWRSSTKKLYRLISFDVNSLPKTSLKVEVITSQICSFSG